MTSRTWGQHFVERTEQVGVPWPKTYFEKAEKAFGVLGAGVALYTSLGPAALAKMTLAEFVHNWMAVAAAESPQVASAMRALWSTRAAQATATQVARAATVDLSAATTILSSTAVRAGFGTAGGALSVGAASLAAAYVGLLLGCAAYATDKTLNFGVDEKVTKLARGFWAWKYDQAAREALGQQLEEKLIAMKALKSMANELGIRPSELYEATRRK